MHSLTILFTALFSTQAYSNDVLEKYGPEYIKERFEFHTKKFSAIDTPRGEKLRIAYVLYELEQDDTLIGQNASASGQLSLQTFPPTSSSNFYNEQIQKAQSRICELIKQQNQKGQIDVVAIGALVNQIEQEQLVERAQYYSQKINALTPQSRELVQTNLDERMGTLEYSRMDYESLAIEMPDYIFSLFDRGCNRANRFSLKPKS